MTPQPKPTAVKLRQPLRVCVRVKFMPLSLHIDVNVNSWANSQAASAELASRLSNHAP
jgi:hypothetical protein